ncbi:MAG: type IV secretion protein DotN [Alphaproteobacteria bacterium]|nr:type IV secretion protein DotN [Alphaproteobacteria bacterium]
MINSPSLGVRRLPDAGAAGSSGAVSKSQQEKILRRDDYTCCCCGFKSKQYQRVIKLNKEPVTLCMFCEQCFSLDSVGAMGSGVLIWLPEISQADLNNLARAIYVARSTAHPLSGLASKALDALLARRTDAKKRLGSDDPNLLATAFYENLSDAEYKEREAKLDGLRLMPLDKMIVSTRAGTMDVFPRILEYWKSPEGPYGKLPVEDWEEMFRAA